MDDLLTIAKKHVLQGYENYAELLSKTSILEVHLNDVFGSRGPNMHDYDNRRDLIRIFNEIAKEIYGTSSDCPVVEEFGSFLMDMFNAKSDLDLSINFRDKIVEARRDAKIKALRRFANKFFVLQKKKHVTNVQPILSAKVPVLKVTDCGTGIECDLSVGNVDGIAKSNIILMISSIDERFKKLCFLMKAWAKAHDINSSKDGSLNSLSLILLVAFHLQTREPPILPPFSAIFKDGTDPEAVKKSIPRFLNYGIGNKESLADLFVALLIMLESVESLWPLGLCVSTYKGSWIYKTWEAKKGMKIGIISIEDFTNRSQNTARAVKVEYIGKIYSSIRRSLQLIQYFAAGRIGGEKLKHRLFGPDSLPQNKVMTNIAHPDPQEPNLQDPTQRKRKRMKQKSETKQQKKLNERTHAEISRYATPDLHRPLASTSGGAMPYHSTHVGPTYGRAMPYHPNSTPYSTSGNAMHTPYHPTGYLPPAPYTPQVELELERPYNFTAHGPYTRPVETNHQHNSRGANSAYPPFYL